MSEATCRFCGYGHATLYADGAFAICDACVARVHELAGDAGDTSDRAVGFEPLDYDYAPTDGEILYLSPRDQFFEVEHRTQTTGPALYFQPVPRSKPAIPITDMAEELGAAIAENALYRVTGHGVPLLETEAWWISALALAPDPVTTSGADADENPANGD